jgi:hypothetical protein
MKNKVALVASVLLLSAISFTAYGFAILFFLNFIGLEVSYSIQNFIALFLINQFRHGYNGFVEGMIKWVKENS